MSSGHPDLSGAVCPYWEAKDKQAIFCEGISDGNRIRLAFSVPADKRNYLKEFCCKDWKKCYIAQALEKKWSDYFEREEE